MCAWETSNTVLDCYSNNPEHLLCSHCAFRAVLKSSPDKWVWMRMHVLVVMHRRTLCENVDSAKIKVPFYTTDIDILHVASMHRIVIHRIDISMNRYTLIYICIKLHSESIQLNSELIFHNSYFLKILTIVRYKSFFVYIIAVLTF